MPGALLRAGLFALFARKSRPGASDGWPLNAVQPLLYLLLPDGAAAARGHDGGACDARAAQRPLQHAQLSAGGANGSACPFASLTTLQAIELRYAVTAAVAVLLVLGYAIEARTKRAAAGEKSPAPAASVWLEYQIAALKVAVLAFSTL